MTSLPPPPPWTQPPPESRSRPTSTDPTPVLSVIGGFNLPTWGNERNRLIRLQGIAVTASLQFFLTLATAAVLPWVLGRPGVPWSVALFAIQIGANFLGSRYIKKRGAWARIVDLRTQRLQMLARQILFMTIFMIWVVGIALAVGGESYFVLYGIFAVSLVILFLIMNARAVARAIEAGKLVPDDQSPPFDPPTT